MNSVCAWWRTLVCVCVCARHYSWRNSVVEWTQLTNATWLLKRRNCNSHFKLNCIFNAIHRWFDPTLFASTVFSQHTAHMVDSQHTPRQIQENWGLLIKSEAKHTKKTQYTVKWSAFILCVRCIRMHGKNYIYLAYKVWCRAYKLLLS